VNTCTTCACWQGEELALLDERADELLRLAREEDDRIDDDTRLLGADDRIEEIAMPDDDDRTDETADERGALELLGGVLDGNARLLTDDLTTSDEAV
jgi:hypothetical protein